MFYMCCVAVTICSMSLSRSSWWAWSRLASAARAVSCLETAVGNQVDKQAWEEQPLCDLKHVHLRLLLLCEVRLLFPWTKTTSTISWAAVGVMTPESATQRQNNGSNHSMMDPEATVLSSLPLGTPCKPHSFLDPRLCNSVPWQSDVVNWQIFGATT